MVFVWIFSLLEGLKIEAEFVKSLKLNYSVSCPHYAHACPHPAKMWAACWDYVFSDTIIISAEMGVGKLDKLANLLYFLLIKAVKSRVSKGISNCSRGICRHICFWCSQHCISIHPFEILAAKISGKLVESRKQRTRKQIRAFFAIILQCLKGLLELCCKIRLASGGSSDNRTQPRHGSVGDGSSSCPAVWALGVIGISWEWPTPSWEICLVATRQWYM